MKFYDENGRQVVLQDSNAKEAKPVELQKSGSLQMTLRLLTFVLGSLAAFGLYSNHKAEMASIEKGPAPVIFQQDHDLN